MTRTLSIHGVARSVATQVKGTEAMEGRWRHVVASESIAKEWSSIIRIGGQSGPGDPEERQRGGLNAGHGRDGPECEGQQRGLRIRW
ncbi:hypothetical protein NDU88_003676 [Pleurodeles waltl]|uniref:Uncharacterized protein n=1 Tax=Pleurodeles waltl TaxID=8319 RepID=A0AAV7KW91_PLEWA|nr:hypothetical protein NDU88_003676 [Pleurodeles waltl]